METAKFVLIGLVIVAVLAALAFVVYEFRQAGGGLGSFANKMLDMFGPDTVTTPPNLQHFIDEPANTTGYTPWTPPIEEDESWPPKWLTKG